MEIDKVTQGVLNVIDNGPFKQEGAYNLRYNGQPLCHGDSEHIKIKSKTDKNGIDVYIDGNTKGEQVHIPVVVTASGMTDVVYNDFYIADGAEVVIVAGCGIHNAGCDSTRHVEFTVSMWEKALMSVMKKNIMARVRGTGDRILNPVTKIYMDENSVFTLDTAQIKGVDSSIRETEIAMEAGAKLFVTERLMTHDMQTAVSNMEIQMNGAGSSAKIASRSVAKGKSSQTFHPKAIGNAACHAHVQCDSIIMDQAEVCSIPEINARHIDASIIHEAAIGRINNEQLIKLRTLGMTEEEAEAVIVDAFLE